MNQKRRINDLVEIVLSCFKTEGYAESGIKRQTRTYSKLLQYVEANGIDEYSEAVYINFMRDCYGITIGNRCGNYSDDINRTVCHLKALWHFQEYGTVHFARNNPKKKPFQCPTCYEIVYAAFLVYCETKKYTVQGLPAILNPAKNLLVYIFMNGISDLNHVTAEHLTKFVTIYIDRSQRYVATIITALRIFFKCLYEVNLIDKQLWILLPRIKYTRDAFVPASWNKNDVIKLLAAVDRGNPRGKRDYAILLILVRLGLRTSDIRNLRLGNLDWEQKRIFMIMTKTKEPLIIPLLDDVGWAIIDYLKNGRPQTTTDYVFVNHKIPCDAFSFRYGFQRMLQKHMRIAGLEIPKNDHCGLHSLRSTLARTMLESGAALPVISEVLGHKSVQSTSYYLKINIDALRKCAIDPEEVFLDEE